MSMNEKLGIFMKKEQRADMRYSVIEVGIISVSAQFVCGVAVVLRIFLIEFLPF